MKKNIIYWLLPFILILQVSCDGLLWNGQPDESGSSLTIKINNPFGNIESTNTSRALALQGKYLFIELARIENSESYTDPVSPFTTEGIWQDTEWGGRAVLTFDLTDLSSIEATFEDVPRDQDLVARVILDVDSDTITNGLAGVYGSTPPICNTYNSSGADIYEQLWVTIALADLESNAISLTLRPVSTDIQLTAVDLVTKPSEEYVDSSAVSYTNTEPQPGNTKFSTINIDLNSTTDYLKDTAVYVNSVFNIPLKGHISLYDETGTVVDDMGESSTRAFYIAYPSIDAVYSNNSFFIGSTIYPSLELSYTDYPAGSYIVNYGILYDDQMYLNGATPSILWYIPTGFEVGDLEFQLLFIDHTSNLTNDYDLWETIDQINALNPIVARDWSDCADLWVSTNFLFNGTYSFSDQPHAVILARVPDGQSFIYARDYFGGA